MPLKPLGGTEILYSKLSSLIDLSCVHLIVSTCGPLHVTKPNILWQHLNTNERAVSKLRDKNYVARLAKIVFVSEWQKNKFIKEFNLPLQKCMVIRNAIDPIDIHQKPEKIRLIYTSTPWRGLDQLINAYKKLNRSDVDLVVYSGTSIYGKQFDKETKHQFQNLYKQLNLIGATHIEYATNNEVREALTKAHILAYPNTWEETSCLSAIEALAAGCKVVTTNNGALSETCEDWADYASLEIFVDKLNYAIDNYIYNIEQVNYYNKHYSWEARIEEWRKLLKEVTENSNTTNKIRKVLIATPAHDGRLDVWYTTSLVNSVRIAQENGIFLHPIFMSYDALVQRARNDLFRLAVEEDYDDIIWIDGDLEWHPSWIMELLASDKDVVGGTYRKKTDDAELYTVNTHNLDTKDGLVQVEGLGLGFVKMSKKAVQDLWNASEVYQNEGRESRMVCDIKIVDGQLCSEDVVVFQKLKDLGYDIWLDPRMTCVHIGTKKFYGNISSFLEKIKLEQKQKHFLLHK
jgi:hypothetical protein